jgi:hypothetical protein
LNLPRWEPRDPCDEWYLAGHLVGAVHDRLLTRGAGGGLGLAGKGKRSPNPGGRYGGPDHRAKVQQRAQELEDQGYTIVAGGGKHQEQAVRHPDPNNPRRRYPDIIAEKDGQRHYENIGRRNKRGDPVKRERDALDDLRKWLPPGTPVEFTPYN